MLGSMMPSKSIVHFVYLIMISLERNKLDDYSLTVVIPLSKELFLDDGAGKDQTEEEYKKWAIETAKDFVDYADTHFGVLTATMNKPL